MSDYAQGFSGKANSLAANEKAPKGNPKRKPAPAPVRVNGAEPHVEKGKPQYHGTSLKPYYPGQKPDHYIGGRGATLPVYVLGKKKMPNNGPALTTLLGAPAEGSSVQRSQYDLEKFYRENHPLGQQILEGVADTVPGVSLAKAIRDHQLGLSSVGSEAFNDVTVLAPELKVAGIFGGLKGLKGLKAGVEAADVAKGVPEEAGKLQSVLSGKNAFEGMGSYEKAGAKLDNPHLGKNARAVRKAQEAGYSAERTARAAALHAIYTDKTLSVAEREARASAVLRGPLPKIDFGGVKELTPQVLDVLKTHVMEHPNILAYQKKRLVSSLNNLANGTVPTKSELILYEHAFGKATADSLRHGDQQSFLNNVLRVANIPRSLMASFDVSAPMRQGLVGLTRHPIISGKNIGPMFRSLATEGYYQKSVSAIEHRPTFPLMIEAKLAITKLGSEVGAREERFPTDIAEHMGDLPVIRNTPFKYPLKVVGSGVRRSGRAYTGYLDNTRADIFDHLIGKAQEQGVNIHDQKFLRGLGSLVNNSTGRGDLGTGAIHEAGKFLNTFFFSPRLLASRVNIIAAPLKYARADPFVRREALKTWLSLAGTLTTVLGALSQVPGLHVEMDPRNPDWGKVRKGNTRIDLAGGFQQPLRLAAQLYTGVAISSTTGKKLNLTAGGFGQPNRLDLFLRFFEGKEAPWASLTTDWLRNSNQVGQKFSWKGELGQRVTPLLAQDAFDIYKSQHGGVDGITAAFGAYALGSTGVGLQTYGPKEPKVRPSSAPSDPYGGGSPYAQDSVESGSVYAQP